MSIQVLRSKERRGVAFVGVAIAVLLMVAVPATGAPQTNVYGDPGSSDYSAAHAVVADADGSLYALGVFSGEFQGKVASGTFDVWMARFDAAGGTVWVRSWDAPEIEGTDWSDPIVSASVIGPWVQSLASIGIDGQGNVVGGFAAQVFVTDKAGNELAAHNTSAAWNAVWNFVVSTAATGGYAVFHEAYYTEAPNPGVEADPAVVAYDIDGGVLWSAAIASDARLIARSNIAALPGGNTAVAYELERLSFQLPAVRVDLFDSSGQLSWSTTIFDRCLGNRNTPDAVLAQGQDVAIEVTVAEQTLSNPCTYKRALVTLDSDSGEIITERPTLSDVNLYWCDDPRDGLITGAIQEAHVSGDECQPDDLFHADVNVPLVGIAGDAEAFALLYLWNIAEGDVGYGILRLVQDGPALRPMEFEFVGPSDGYRPTDIAMTDEGPVIVGRAFNTAWISAAADVRQVNVAAAPGAGGGAAVLTRSGFASSGRFLDDNGDTFESDIEWLADAGVTRGCNPPTNSEFYPDSTVTRGQMAAFLSRALGLSAALDNPFTDDDESIFEADIERLAAAGITKGCNPPDNDLFCPDAVVTRGQMAAFLHRALG